VYLSVQQSACCCLKIVEAGPDGNLRSSAGREENDGLSKPHNHVCRGRHSCAFSQVIERQLCLRKSLGTWAPLLTFDECWKQDMVHFGGRSFKQKA
jgi:hypothetical protein